MYWWYPGGSELFASGLYSVAGPLTVGLSGTVALLILAHRIFEFGEEQHLSPLSSGAVSALLVTTSVIAAQAANLENDVWLATFALEIVWCVAYEQESLVRVAGACSLIKPFGLIFTVVGLICGRASSRIFALSLVPILVWIVRDSILWRGAVLSPAGTAVPHIEQTTIAGQGYEGLLVLARAISLQDAGFWLLTAAAIVALLKARDRVSQAMTAVGVAFFFLAPFGFKNDVAQLSTGQSLRFALPALVPAFSNFLAVIGRAGLLVFPVGVAIAAFQAFHLYRIFENDATTHNIVSVLALSAAVLLVPPKTVRSALTAALFLGLVTYSARLAGSHPIDYYNDWLSRDGRPSSLFTWLATSDIERLVGWQMRLGAVNVVAPRVAIFDVVQADPCGEAKRLHADLLLSDDPEVAPALLSEKRAVAKSCGKIIFDDGVSLVVSPGT
jgi:hypothetical protein